MFHRMRGSRTSLPSPLALPRCPFPAVAAAARSVVEGPMLFVRFGTCGGMKAEVPEGSVVVSSLGALSVIRLPDAFHEPEKPGAPVGASYHISKVGPLLGVAWAWLWRAAWLDSHPAALPLPCLCLCRWCSLTRSAETVRVDMTVEKAAGRVSLGHYHARFYTTFLMLSSNCKILGY